MKLNAFSTLTLLVPVAALALVTGLSAPSFAGHPASGAIAKVAHTPPAVALPYTFICPHCGIKITIKTAADWNKDCNSCACGKTNLGCYFEKKK